MEQDEFKDRWAEGHKIPSCEIFDGPEVDLPAGPTPILKQTPSWLQAAKGLIILAMLIGLPMAFCFGVSWISSSVGGRLKETKEVKTLIADVWDWNGRANYWFVACHFVEISEESEAEARAQHRALLQERDALWARIDSLKPDLGLDAAGGLNTVLLQNIIYRMGPWFDLPDFRKRFPLEEMGH